MENNKKDEEQEKGFVVKDKRFSAKKEDKEESKISGEGKSEEASKKDDASAQEALLPEIDFTHFILSLSSSVLIQLGEIQDPFTQESAKNLPSAKQTIDLIGMLKEKTKGNLTPEEEKVIDYVLYDLRMRYVKAAG
jgi:hypothetical protein